jgi:hypothetical protein
MNKDHCWYNLNIDVSTAIDSNWQWQSTGHKNNMRNYKADEMFSDWWLDKMSSINIPITGSLVHHKPKFFSSSEAHVDTYKGVGGAVFGINWVIGGRNSEMIWYEIPDDIYRGADKITPANTPYVAWPISELKEIDRCVIGSQAVLVRVDRPHAIVVRDQDRLSISARTNMKFLSWNGVVNYLNKKNLLTERD